MELLNPSVFISINICCKDQLKNISKLIDKYTSKGDDFLNACEIMDDNTANQLVEETIEKMTGYDSIFTALEMFADKFPQIPGLNEAVSSSILETDKVLAIARYSDQISKVLNNHGECDDG